ncbi:MAG: type I-C CRISPR-associated endonuclease Cas1c [Coriobacteriales bacterium]|jgi:CRISPR-associated protein Cas1|nr:type I-C CRISPR-associated endonuclease Cas1c [Coriobacteriales bacterium]
MRRLLNTLYITTPDAYLSLDGENIVILRNENEVLRVPLHNLEGIVTFGYTGASPALMGACAKRAIALSFLTGNGQFLASVTGSSKGNVLLRRTQYRLADDENASARLARNIIIGKLYNSRWVLERAVRDHDMRVDGEQIKRASTFIADSVRKLRDVDTLESVRGIEGEAATRYFSVFDELILNEKESFFFKTRNRRPPTDRVNAMLSLSYVLLAAETASALNSVGLDPFVGFLHRDRPGRRSLALDLMEELRSVFADRFVLSMINTRRIEASDFQQKESGAVILKDDARKEFLKAWQNRKREKIEHPFLREKIEWGLVPHAQALLLARHLRGDLDAYPPFMWK